jgi:hypothetical protein
MMEECFSTSWCKKLEIGCTPYKATSIDNINMKVDVPFFTLFCVAAKNFLRSMKNQLDVIA